MSNNGQATGPDDAVPPSARDWKLRLLSSRHVKASASINSFSAIPWRLEIRNNVGNSIGPQETSTTLPDVPYPPQEENENSERFFLQLRRQQNLSWANSRLGAGDECLAQNQITQALVCYQQGLDLEPRHVPLLLASARAYQRSNDVSHALHFVKKVIKEDETNDEAQALRHRLTTGITQTARTKAKSERALQDAVLERAMQKSDTKQDVVAPAASSNPYPLLSSPSDSEEDSRRRKKSKKRKKKKHKRKYNSESEEERKAKRRRKRDRRRRRERHDTPNSEEDNASEDRKGSRRRRGRSTDDSRRGRKRRRRSRSSSRGTTGSEETVDSLLVAHKRRRDSNGTNVSTL